MKKKFSVRELLLAGVLLIAAGCALIHLSRG